MSIRYRLKMLPSSVSNSVAFFGDPHGNFAPVRNALRTVPPKWSFFLGDFDLDRPMDVELAGLMEGGSDLHFIHGNHDADRESWHDFVFESSLAGRNISGRVVEIDGVKIAGLGGVFHPEVWHPQDGDGAAKFACRDDFIAANSRKIWRGGLPLRHRSTIFPEDFNELAACEADILISHEAPSSHRYGHAVIDDLAEVLGAKVIVHGHLHQKYEASLPNGIKVFGLGKAETLATSFEALLGYNKAS